MNNTSSLYGKNQFFLPSIRVQCYIQCNLYTVFVQYCEKNGTSTCLFTTRKSTFFTTTGSGGAKACTCFHLLYLLLTTDSLNNLVFAGGRLHEISTAQLQKRIETKHQAIRTVQKQIICRWWTILSRKCKELKWAGYWFIINIQCKNHNSHSQL